MLPMALGFPTIYLVIEETKRLRALVKTYQQIFGSKTSVDTWNHVAPTTAGLIQQSLHEAMILSMGRMLDSPSTRSSENLSLEKLIQYLPTNSGFFAKKLEELRDELRLIQEWRNKYIAHRDEDVAYSFFNASFGENPILGNLSGNDILDAAGSTCDLVAEIETTIGFSNALQRRDIPGPDGGQLIQVLMHCG